MNRLFKFVTDTLEAMNLLQKHAHMTQLLVLLYSAIDTMAWVSLAEGDVERKDFKEWVEQYLLRESSLPCTADDLYSARCGLVHTNTAESSSTNKGAARQIWYFGKGASEEFLKTQIGDRTDVVAVRVVDLILAFSDGAFRCIEDLMQNSRRNTIALEKINRWLAWVGSEPQTSKI